MIKGNNNTLLWSKSIVTEIDDENKQWLSIIDFECIK